MDGEVAAADAGADPHAFGALSSAQDRMRAQLARQVRWEMGGDR